MSESNDDLVKFLKESLLVSLDNMNRKVDTMSDSLNEKIDNLSEKLEVTQVSVSTLSNKVVAYDVERSHCKKQIKDMCTYLSNDKVRLDDLEYKKIPELKDTIKEVQLVKTSYWKAMAAILVICAGLTGLIGFVQGSFGKKDTAMTKDDFKALVHELRAVKNADTTEIN